MGGRTVVVVSAPSARLQNAAVAAALRRGRRGRGPARPRRGPGAAAGPVAVEAPRIPVGPIARADVVRVHVRLDLDAEDHQVRRRRHVEDADARRRDAVAVDPVGVGVGPGPVGVRRREERVDAVAVEEVAGVAGAPSALELVLAVGLDQRDPVVVAAVVVPGRGPVLGVGRVVVLGRLGVVDVPDGEARAGVAARELEDGLLARVNEGRLRVARNVRGEVGRSGAK